MEKIDARALAQAGFKYLGRSYSEMDCQGFVERLLHDGYTHIDAAYGGSDYTAMTIAKKQRDGTIVMYGKLWQKDVLSVLETILYEADRLRCGIVVRVVKKMKIKITRDDSDGSFRLHYRVNTTSKVPS